MACFLVPTVAAIFVGILMKFFGKEFSEKWKIYWLLMMLVGGVLMLVIDHILHQEIVPQFPFLTALQSPVNTEQILHEIVTGVLMTLAVFVVWIILIAINAYLNKQKAKVIEA